MGGRSLHDYGRMWEEVGFPSEGSMATLTARRWELRSGARPFDIFATR